MSKSQVFDKEQVTIGLNIGCGGGGTCLRPPYINLDVDRKKWEQQHWIPKRKTGPMDFVVADAIHLPFRDEAFDEVYASSVLEHFNYQWIERILQEWNRVACKGAKIKICVPSMEYIIDFYLGKYPHKDYDKVDGMVLKKDKRVVGINKTILSALYGSMPNTAPQETTHMTCFDFQLLRWHLQNTGWKNIQHGKIHSCPYRALHTSEIVVVAEK